MGLQFSELLAGLAKSPFIDMGDAPLALREITRIAAKGTVCERVSVWELTGGGAAIVCRCLYERSSGRYTSGNELLRKDYQSYFAAIAGEQALIADDARSHPATSCFRDNYLDPLGITSMLNAPVLYEGKTIGVICFEHTGPARKWTEDEVEFAWSIADMLARVQSATERRRLKNTVADEENLRFYEVAFKAVFDQTAHLIGILDTEGVLLAANATSLNMIGAEEADVLGQKFPDTPWWLPKDRHLIADAIDRAAQGERVTFQTTHPDNHGYNRHIFFSIGPYLNEDGQVQYLIPEGRDITDIVYGLDQERLASDISGSFSNAVGPEIDEAITEALRRVAEFAGADQSSLFIFTGDYAFSTNTHEWCKNPEDSRIRYFQNYPLKDAGYSMNQLLKEQVINYTSLEDIPEQATAEREFFKKNPFRPRLHVPLIRRGKITGAIGIYRSHEDQGKKWPPEFVQTLQTIGSLILNVLDRKDVEAQLAESEKNLRITLRSIGDAVIATDLDGAIVRMNPVAERLTGYTFDEAEGKQITEVLRLQDMVTGNVVSNPVLDVLQKERTVGLAKHTILRSKTGDAVQIADSAAPIRSDRGDMTGVVMVFRDISEEYRLQEKVQQSQKMEAIGQLAGGIAHDFNNMLGAIMGTAEILDLKLDPADDEKRKLVQMIMSSSERAAGLTGKLLTFARKHPPVYEPVDMHDLVTQTVELLRSTAHRNVHFETGLDAEASIIEGNADQLQSSILNLGINAVHAMPSGGTLTLNTLVVELDKEYTSNLTEPIAPGTYLELEVIDTGTGIENENIDKIFEPFFTTKSPHQGTGMGLSVVLGTVQQHGGTVTVYSELGRGTCFRLYLPLNEKMKAVLKPRNTESIIPGSGLVMVVDDEMVIRNTAKSMLESLGYEVVLAADGLEAVELYQRESANINIVLLDMIMPKMDGKDCFFALRKMRHDIPIVISSGFTRDQDLATLQSAGLNGFIRKPYRRHELSRILSLALNS